jgi:hypothetical protein
MNTEVEVRLMGSGVVFIKVRACPCSPFFLRCGVLVQ